MKFLSALLCLSVVAIVAAEFGHYVPKGFYTIDEDGNQSPMYFIESIPELFHRSRRQVNPGFQFPGFQPLPFPAFPQPGQGNFHGTSISSTINSNPSGGVGQRFGEENEQTIVTTVNKDGNVEETVTHIRPDGSTYTTHNRRGPNRGQQGQQGNKQQSSTSTSG
ncbi:uncharacterized protein LOC134827221 [Culicoides brevitarsis]|uniref:uncharacterized protein LOC134827221 n=1 Tax=Culicoides brevitarsis TaxID=469753 RepID=UPI00307BDAAA